MARRAIGCGDTSETVAACMHGAVAVLYTVMIWFHTVSVFKHWSRRD